MNREQISEVIINNLNKIQSINESTTADVGTFPMMATSMIKQTIAKSVLPEITSFIPISSPESKVYFSSSYYAKDNESYSSMRVLQVNTTAGITAGSTYTTSSGASIRVDFIDIGQILIYIISGTVSANDTFLTGSVTIQNVFSSRIVIKKIMSQYSKNISETGTPLELKHDVISLDIVTETRKIKSTITQEFIKDLMTQMGVSAEEFIVEIITKEVLEEMENTIFNYMHTIATQATPLLLSDNSGTRDKIYVFSDIYTRILEEVQKISQLTGRNMSAFIVTDAKNIGALLASGAFTITKDGDASSQNGFQHSNYIGRIMGLIDVYQNDFPAYSQEILVGYKSKSHTVGDAGIVFCPYVIQTSFATDPDSGQEHLNVFVRYGFGRNVFDEAITGSYYFTKFTVDYTNVSGY